MNIFVKIGHIMLGSMMALSAYPSHADEVDDWGVLKNLSLEELMLLPVSTAGKTEEKISDIPASVVVITRAEIAQYGYRTLGETLSSIPGLYGIEQYYYEGVALGVRGFWSNWTNKQIIILVDGIPQINPHRNNYILPQIAVPVEAIERIEVVRGPLSVIYGDGAFFGAINIITDNEKIPDKTQYRVSAGVGSRNTSKAYGQISGGDKDLDMRFNLIASHYTTDGIDASYEDMTAPGYMEGLGLSSRSTKGMLDNTENYLSLNAYMKDFSVHFSHVETDMDAFLVFPGDADGNHQVHTVNTLGLGYSTEVSDKLSVQARVSYRENKLEYDYYPTAFLHTGWPAAGEVRKGRTYEMDLNATYKPTTSTRIVTGLSYRIIPEVSIALDVPAVGLDKNYYEVTDSITTTGLFAQVTHDFSDTLKLVGGIRFERLENYNIRHASLSSTTPFDNSREYDKGGVELIPRFAAIYQPSKKHSFKLLYGEAVSWPSFDQNQPRVQQPLLDNLELEKVKTLELVYDWAYSKKLGVGLSVFRNQMENLVVRSLQLDPVTNAFSEIQSNSGELSTTGLEATMRFRPTTRLNIELSASYQTTDDAMNDADAAYSPNILGYAKLAYNLNPDVTLAFDGYYTGTMKPTIDPNTQKRIGDDSPGYFNLGMNLRIDNLIAQGTFVDFRVTNLLDEEIRYPVFTNNDWATKGTIGEDRSIFLSVGADF